MNGEMGQVRTTLVENLKELNLPAMRGCFEEAARKATQGIRSTSGEVPGKLRRQAFAGEGESTDEGAVGGRVPGPQREFTDLRESWRGEEPSFVCHCARVDRHAREKDQVRYLSAAGARSAGREAGSAVRQGN